MAMMYLDLLSIQAACAVSYTPDVKESPDTPEVAIATFVREELEDKSGEQMIALLKKAGYGVTRMAHHYLPPENMSAGDHLYLAVYKGNQPPPRAGVVPVFVPKQTAKSNSRGYMPPRAVAAKRAEI